MDNLDEKYRSKNPFSVPDGYFESLGERVLERVEEERAPQPVSVLQLLRPYLGLAGVFVFAAIVARFFLPSLVDGDRLLAEKAEQVAVVGQKEEEENIFDEDFNPSREEIIEYLSQEADVADFLYAERR